MKEASKNPPKLTRGAVGPLLFRLTCPMILGMISMVSFNLADAYFIGKLGTDQQAALTFTFPVVVFIASIALGLGNGASAVISRAIGKGNREEVRRLATDSLLLSLGTVAVFVLIGMFTINPLFRILGAKEQILPHIKQYMEIWYWGMIFVVVPMVGNNIIRATGDMLLPGLTMSLAALINFGLDPLFIFGIGPFPELGIRGAAAATVISRMITFTLALVILIKREKVIVFHIPEISKVIDSWKKILYVGIPVAGTRVIMPLAAGIMTRIISVYGKEAVAAYGVATRIEFFLRSPLVALAVIFGPFVGQNWMSGQRNRVVSGVRISGGFCIVWGITAYILLLLAGPFIAPLFNPDPDVIGNVVLYLRIGPLAIGFFGVFQISTTSMNVLKRPFTSSALAIFHMFILLIPLAYAGRLLFGLKGIFLAIPVSICIAGSISFAVLGHIIRKDEKTMLPSGKTSN